MTGVFSMTCQNCEHFVQEGGFSCRCKLLGMYVTKQQKACSGYKEPNLYKEVDKLKNMFPWINGEK